MDIATATVDRRKQNRSHIYHYIYDTKEFCSRQSLARDLGLSPPTVYQNLAKLMADGLIRDSGEQQSAGGRKASGLSIVPDARVAVGISVTEHHLRLAAADLLLNELAYQVTRRSIMAQLSAFPTWEGDFFRRWKSFWINF